MFIKKIIPKQMESHYRATLIVLVSITTVGLIAISFGNPKFIDRAVVLELSFVALSALVWKGYSKDLYACITLAALVIVGHSPALPNANLMMTFSKPLNAILLVMGGYVLQGALISASLRSILGIISRRLTASA